MLHPAQKIASFFVARKLIPAQDYEWAVYGLQRRLLVAVFYPIPVFDWTPEDIVDFGQSGSAVDSPSAVGFFCICVVFFAFVTDLWRFCVQHAIVRIQERPGKPGKRPRFVYWRFMSKDSNLMSNLWRGKSFCDIV